MEIDHLIIPRLKYQRNLLEDLFFGFLIWVVVGLIQPSLYRRISSMLTLLKNFALLLFLFSK